MVKYILCFILGAVIGILIMSLVGGNRPDDEYYDGYKAGYIKAKEEYSKLP